VARVHRHCHHHYSDYQTRPELRGRSHRRRATVATRVVREEAHLCPSLFAAAAARLPSLSRPASSAPPFPALASVLRYRRVDGPYDREIPACLFLVFPDRPRQLRNRLCVPDRCTCCLRE